MANRTEVSRDQSADELARAIKRARELLALHTRSTGALMSIGEKTLRTLVDYAASRAPIADAEVAELIQDLRGRAEYLETREAGDGPYHRDAKIDRQAATALESLAARLAEADAVIGDSGYYAGSHRGLQIAEWRKEAIARYARASRAGKGETR